VPSIVYAPRATARIVGIDTDQKVTHAMALELVAAGVAFAVRYVSIGAARPEDLDADELAGLVAANLPVWAVQHAHQPGWEPSPELGAQDGAAAARNAQAAGLPSGCALAWDAEGIAGSSTATLGYGNAWFDQVQVGPRVPRGFAATMYVGDDVPLTSAQLFHELSFRRYWRSASTVPNVDVRGYQCVQLWPFDQEIIPGLKADLDVVQSDHLGDRIPWCVP
jgi:Domain of unknown function (DUF1906)